MANDKKPKLFLGQNMSTRVRSPLFWTGVVGIIGSAVVSFGGLIGLDLSDKVDEVTANSSQIIEFVFLILGLIGVTNDPTSKNYRDTGMAQTYSKPRDENVDPVEYQKVVSDEKVTPERKELTPEEFDTSEPFTDDTDEVEFDVADYEYDEELKRGASRYHDDEVLKVSDEDDSKTN